MKYFCYTTHLNEITIIILDIHQNTVNYCPQRNWLGNLDQWFRYYIAHRTEAANEIGGEMFEICEGQYNHFCKEGIRPMNWDWEA